MKTTLLLPQRLIYHLHNYDYFEEHGGIELVSARNELRHIFFEDGLVKTFDISTLDEFGTTVDNDSHNEI